MKKLTLFLVAMLFSALSFAALNPYAYGLKSDLSNDEKTVTITYKLNAPATAVSVVVLDGETVLKTQASTGITQGEHSVDISTDGFPKGKTLSWKVEVKGAAVTSVAIHDVKYNAYHPSGIDIDNNPESPHFGRILCTEAMHSVQGKTRTDGKTGTNGTNYLGTTLGAGIYEFDPTFTFVKGYTGEKTFVTTSNHYAPRRIRIAKDGRIFATAQDNGGEYLWEIKPDNLNNWTSVFQGTNSNFTLKDGSGNFIAGTNSGFDVRGTGENLQLLMLSANKPGSQVATFKLHEYNLGDATTWSTIPTRELSGCQLHSNMITNQSQVQYDSDGGYWITYWVNTTSFGGIAHFTKEGTKDYSKNSINMRNAGFRFNHDFTKVIIATNDVIGASKTYKQATVYAVSKDANGVPVLTKEKTIDMTTVGNNLNDFAWDYADNIYVVGNSSEYVAVYPYTHAADKVVSTPCRADEAIVIPAPAQLNPFAYNLWSELSADEKNLTIKYSLNAKATSVEWVLMDGNNVVKTIDLASLGLEKGDYTTTISTTDFPQYKQLTWKIEVKGVAVNKPTEYPINYDLYHPSSIDIDNNPENPTFGLILCNEAMQSVKGQKQTDTGEDYLSSSLGAGIYAFNAAFENTGKYNGGIEFTKYRPDASTTTAYAPRRIRISDDGRIFVSSLNTDGHVLWEVNPDDLNNWEEVIAGTPKSGDINSVVNGSTYIGGPNVGFDTKGSGENLKLVMLSGIGTLQCNEYDLGTATLWDKAPRQILYNKYMVNYTGAQVQYDNEGGYWFCQYRITTSDSQPSLVHINAAGEVDYTEKVNYRLNAGFRFNNDFTKVIIAGIAAGTKNSKKATLYKVSKNASGAPVLTEELVIDMATIGNNLNDFAWDYAGNLYACGNSSEKLAVWAMPHSSDDVVATPAASKYAFSIGKYTVTVNTNDVNKGTVTGGGEYGAGAVVTLTATPKEGYELLYWSDRSKENPRNITVDGNEALSAYFIKKNDVEPTFSITKVWENIAEEGSSTNNGYQGAGWDGKIYVKDRYGDKILVYSETGSSPYVEFGGSYEGLAGDQAITMDDAGNMIIRSGSTFFYDAPSQISIFKKGETTYKTIGFTLPEAGRCDFISASGDLFSAEGGYVYFYCQTKTGVSRLHVKNGGANVSDVTVDFVGNITTQGNTQSHVMVDIFGNLVTHSRTNPITTTINAHTGETMSFILPNNHKANALGGCSFELAGKEFWAFNVKGTNTCTSEWNLYNLTDGKFESSAILYVKNQTETNPAANWLNVQVVDEKTAYIYQFCPKVGAAVWKVTRDHIVTATAENGTVEGAGTYKDNATATLTATPNDGYRFKNWTKNGLVVSTDNPYSFTVTEDVELVANFDGPFCELILNTNDEEKGTVSGAGFYNVGQTVTIKATPKAGYKLLYWSDRSTQNPRTITMNKKEALSAYFVKVYDEEPTFAIEKVWENTDVPTSSNNGFQAVGWDEKIYMKDRGNKQILVFSDATPYTTYVATDDKDDQPIAIDDAGNIIIRSGSNLFYNAPKQVTIYKNGDKTGKVIDFTLPASGRCDFISASGDIYSAEGGYVYFYCENQTTVSRLYIKNGGASTADVSVDEVGTNLTAGSSQSHVFTNIFGDLMTHTRASVKVLQEVNAVTGVATTMTLPDFKESTLGGCSFELGGKELIAYNIKGTDYNSEWNLYNMTDKEFVSNETLYAKDRTSKKTYGAANWLNVQVVDEETAYIYQFCPEVAVAVWKVSLINTVVIDDKAVNSIALDEYDGQTVTAKVTRAFSNDSYKTLTLPFDMDVEQIQDVFGDAKVYAFTTVVEGSDALHLQFEPTTSIVAGTPYIIDLPDGDYDAKDGFTIENVTINTTLNSVKKGVITMEPVLDGGGRLDEAGQYWLSADNFLYNAGNYPTALLGLRAYFTSSSSMPIRARVVFDENQATSIPVVVAPENNVRKVMKNGQLIIIRGEQKYNVQGQRME